MYSTPTPLFSPLGVHHLLADQDPLEEEVRQQETSQAEHRHDLDGHPLGALLRWPLGLRKLRCPFAAAALFCRLLLRGGGGRLALSQAAGDFVLERGDGGLGLGELVLKLLVRVGRCRLDRRRHGGGGGGKGCLLRGLLGLGLLLRRGRGDGRRVVDYGGVVGLGGVGWRRRVGGGIELGSSVSAVWRR